MMPTNRGFLGGLWHGAFLALGMALTHPTTVIAAFVSDLTGSTVWVGGLSTVLTVAAALPQVFVARWIEPRPRKIPFLLLAVYVRVASWFALALLICRFGESRPEALAWSLVGFLGLFYAVGGLGGVAYTDIIGKVIPPRRRGAFFGGKEAVAAPLVIGAALLTRKVLAEAPYPLSYAMLFGLASLALAIASIGLWLIREPVDNGSSCCVLKWRDYAVQVLNASRQLGPLVVFQLLTGFSLMVLPFYVVFARDRLGAPTEAIGWFLLAQVSGGLLGSLAWARIVDRAGTRRMLTYCAGVSAATPALAVFSQTIGWPALLPVFFLAGAAFSGRRVGFSAAVLEIAPATERPTYAGVNAMLVLPVAFLPALAGILLTRWSYNAVFLIAAGFIAVGGFWTRRLPAVHPER